MKKAIVIGKFYPLHKGHDYLIETATKNSDQLTIIVCHTKQEKIPGYLRKKWIKEMYPETTVKLINCDNLDPDDSKLWAEMTLKWLGFRPDVVYTSEDYGEAYAKYMHCQHVLVDRKRKKYPVSGTKIRNNPFTFWQFLTPPVKAFYSIRVVIIGAESTGTTTLASELAKHYQTCWVPEYGRYYYEGRLYSHTDQWNTQEFMHIAAMQDKAEEQLAKCCNKILICDTDPFAATIWHQRYIRKRSAELEHYAEKKKHDLYILTDCDIPFIQDGTRDGEYIRNWMHKEFIKRLKGTDKQFIIVSGKKDKRLKKAVNAIETILKKKIVVP